MMNASAPTVQWQYTSAMEHWKYGRCDKIQKEGERERESEKEREIERKM